MKRAVASWVACAAALGLGLATAVLSTRNRARGSELDQLERWCEAQSRRNELRALEIARQEWLLLSERGLPRDAVSRGGGRVTP